MPRLIVLVEGETEESFVNELLNRHLGNFGWESVTARLMGKARLRRSRGGIRGWPPVRDEIAELLRQDSGLSITTMVDYYGLPQGDPRNAWPGRTEASTLRFQDQARSVEDALLDEVSTSMGDSFNISRFVPFIVMHEFEGLLFSDCEAFARGLYRPELEGALNKEAAAFDSPEEINDTLEGHPSRRLLDLMPEYEKPLYGTLAALEIGLDAIRSKCQHFAQWMDRLESLGGN